MVGTSSSDLQFSVALFQTLFNVKHLFATSYMGNWLLVVFLPTTGYKFYPISSVVASEMRDGEKSTKQ